MPYTPPFSPQSYDPDAARAPKSHNFLLRNMAIVTSAYFTHKYLLKTRADYAQRLYNFFKQVEELSPSRILRTFALSDYFSSYLPQQLIFEQKQLWFGQRLTDTGAHLQRLLGPEFDLKKYEKLTFQRTSAGSPYLQLAEDARYQVRFAQAGKITGSSFRYGAPLIPEEATISKPRLFAKTRLGRLEERFENLKATQYLRTPAGGTKATVAGAEMTFQPLFAKVKGKGVRSFLDRLGRFGFEMAERPQRSMFSEMGLGLRVGSFNKIAHIPGVGEGGILNAMMAKRVLPIAAGAVGLGFLDYLLGHKPSDWLLSLPLRANVFRAEMTDKTPGLRKTTDFYANVVPGHQYGPLALPLGGIVAGGLYHYARTLLGKDGQAALNLLKRRDLFRKRAGIGALVGALMMAPFIPGMIGSRETAGTLQRQYAGEEEVPIRSGRWWSIGSTPAGGGRIKYFRPHWFALHKARAEEAAVYGDEKEKWKTRALWFVDPYRLERRQYEERPYPITSPAFSNIPLIGPLLAATIGRIVKPPVRMHPEWDTAQYTLGSARIQPRGEQAVKPIPPVEEYGLKDVIRRQTNIFAEYTGLPGFMAKTAWQNTFPQKSAEVQLMGSRQMTNFSRRYYEKEIGEVLAMRPSIKSPGTFGYTEPFRRFVQREDVMQPQVNEVPNKMPSFLPGANYFINFHAGDPYVKIQEGYARLPGPGYEALHPELRGLRGDQYPDVYKYKILADVAPYSTEYLKYRSRVAREARWNTETRITFEQTEEQVRQMKESSLQIAKRRFTEDTETLRGTVKAISPAGVQLTEYPDKFFQLSQIGMSAADLSAVTLREHNNLSRTEVAQEVDSRQKRQYELLTNLAGPGTDVTLVVPKGAGGDARVSQAVLFSGHTNVNQAVVDQGLGRIRKDFGGAEARAMYGELGQVIGKMAEKVSFTGDEKASTILKLLPTPYHTKLWQERTAIAQYKAQEVYGARMRRWNRPVHDILGPWFRGAVRRMTGDVILPPEVQERRNVDELADALNYLRAYQQAAAHPQERGKYTNKARRTNVGINQFAAPSFVASTLPRREQLYFQAFINETDPDKQAEILRSVSPAMARALSAQWSSSATASGGRQVTEEGVEEYQKSGSNLDYGDYMRSKDIAGVFARLHYGVPSPGSPIWSEDIDYEDVKLKIVQQEGYDYHDFNIYDDRANVLWRKPYVEGAVRDLVTADKMNAERIRQVVEGIILQGSDKTPAVMASTRAGRVGRSNVTFHHEVDDSEEVSRDVRRNPEEYQ